MTDFIDPKLLRNRLSRFLIKPEDTEDAAAEALLSYCENKSQNRPAHGLASDWLRKFYGDSRLLNSKFEKEIPMEFLDSLENEVRFDHQQIDLNYVKNIDTVTKAMMTLRLKFGFNYKDIGELFGLGEASALQYVKNGAIKARKAYTDE